MLINLRNALMTGKRTPTAKDYVQSGLIAMWDGIENAGWGTHDASATVWVDLSGNGNDLELKNTAHFDTNSLVSANRDYLSAVLAKSLPYDTIEVCGFWDNSRNASALVCFGNSIDDERMMSITKNAIQIYNGGYQLRYSGLINPKSTWSGVHSGDSHTPYTNGVLAAGTYSTNEWGNRTGTFGLSGSSNYSRWNFVGNYYNIRLYSRALTADEIARNYIIDKARFNLP